MTFTQWKVIGLTTIGDNMTDDTLNEYNSLEDLYSDVRKFLKVTDTRRVDDKQIIMMVKVKKNVPDEFLPFIHQATGDFAQKVVAMTETIVTWFVYSEKASEVLLI